MLRVAALAFLATAHAAWPRLETGDTWYRAVHVPKSGGTTHDRALVAVYCFHAGHGTYGTIGTSVVGS